MIVRFSLEPPEVSDISDAPALIVTSQYDVLRDQGEVYAQKLHDAGVPVKAIRCNGIIHDFMMIDYLKVKFYTPLQKQKKKIFLLDL